MNPNTILQTLRKTLVFFLFSSVVVVFSCKNKKPEAKDIVRKPEQLEDRVKKNLHEILDYASHNRGKINDSTALSAAHAVLSVYEKNDYTPIWSVKGEWTATGDSLYQFIKDSKLYGLFPSDYFYGSLKNIQDQLKTDSLAKKDAALWSRADVMMTDALLLMSQHLKRGRLPYDSLSSKKDSGLSENYYVDVLNRVVKTNQLSSTLGELEPKLLGYVNLKDGIKHFLDTARFKKYTYLFYPFTDSLAFYSQLEKRLYEEKMLDTLLPSIDTTTLRKALIKYQARKKLKTTGKVNENTVNSLNDTDWERFKRIALTLDKYKLMADTMPITYVWVNLPSFSLKIVDSDSVALQSRIIVGASKNTHAGALFGDIEFYHLPAMDGSLQHNLQGNASCNTERHQLSEKAKPDGGGSQRLGDLTLEDQMVETEQNAFSLSDQATAG